MKNEYLKPIIVTCFLFLLFSSANVQEKIGNTEFRASYFFSYKTDSTQNDFAKTDLIFLDIGETSTKFYSRYEQIRDSVKTADLKQGLSPYDVVDNMRKVKKGVKTVVYKFLKKNQIHTTEGLIKYYYYEDILCQIGN